MLRVSVKRARKIKNERFRDATMKCTVYIEKAPSNRKETWQARKTESRYSWQVAFFDVKTQQKSCKHWVSRFYQISATLGFKRSDWL